MSATIPELVHFDSVVVRDGVKGGSGGALHLQWDGSSSCYDPQVEATITQSRWLQLKRIYKLCDNDQAPKKGQDNYNPAYKYDYLFCCIVENMNAITRRADLDLCGDETTYATQAYGEAGTNLVSRRVGKPGVTKGGQIVLLCDTHRKFPQAFMHRHNLNPRPDKWPEGPSEVKQIVTNGIAHLVKGNPPKGSFKQIFDKKPHMTWDNYFSGDAIMDWLGKEGYGATMTTAVIDYLGRFQISTFINRVLPPKIRRQKWHASCALLLQ